MNPAEALPDDLAGESRFQLLTRLGFAGRGLLYIVIGLLVILTGRTEDLTGALDYLGHGIGKVLLAVMAVGMAVYGVWRLTDAAFGIESGRHHWKAWRKRAAAAASGTIYGFLAYKSVLILLGEHVRSGEAKRHAADALHMPAGELIVLIAAGMLFGAAIVQFYKAVSCSFLKPLECQEYQKTWIRWLGRIGYAVRGLVFLVIAYLLAQSAFHTNTAEAGGLEQALNFLSPVSRRWIAGGLMLFGAMSLVEARFRRIHRPPRIEQVAEKVAEKAQG